MIDARGSRTEYGYNAVGQRTLVRDALGNETRIEYDAAGRRTAMTDARGQRTEYVYDAAGRLLTTRFPDGTTRTASYDPLGRKIAATDELGRTTRYGYDAKGNLTTVTDPDGGVTGYTYDAQGNKLTQTDAEGRTTTWAYDSAGRVVSRTLPGGQTEFFSYDAAGNRTAHTDFNGETTRYQYDVLGREVLRDYPFDADVATTYTASGQVASVSDGRGTTRYQYDSADRLTRIDYPTGSHVAYGYDAAGNRVQLTTPHGTTDYGFDALGRLSSVRDAAGTTTYGYDAVGNRARVTYPSGVETRYTYDGRNRLTRIETRDAFNRVLMGMSYTLNDDGTRARISEDSGRIVDYRYDALGRLTEEAVTDAAVGDRTTRWSYDAVGNRLTETTTTATGSESVSYGYDVNDRLLSEDGPLGTTLYSYDANGNLTERSGPGGATSYGWNDDNRLVDAVTPTDSISYTYDASGIRQTAVRNGQETRYLVDPNRDYAEVVAEEDALGAPSVLYTHADDLVSQRRNANTAYFHADALGSTRLLTGSAGAVTDSYVYQAFGEVEAETGVTKNAYRFTGEQFDSDIGQYFLRQRYYDPVTGRFTAMDPWMGREIAPITLNKYLYAYGNPVLYTDPSGYFGLVDVGAALNIRGIQSASAQVSFRVTVRKIGKELACVAVEEIVSDLILQQLTGGIYILNDGNNGYVGRTNDFERRIREHGRDAAKKVQRVLALFHIDGDRNDMRLVEQFFMDLFREANQPLTNRINSISPSPASANSQRLRRMVDRLDFCK